MAEKSILTQVFQGENLTQQEAAMLSINDCSYLMKWIFLGLLCILP